MCKYLDIESFSIYFFPPQICNGGPRSSQKRYTLTLGRAVFFALNFFCNMCNENVNGIC
jgi:hypothetical protein